MADNSNNILNQLQQHSIQPPAGAFEKAWQAIAQDANNAANDVDAESEIFARLQEHSMPAPAFDFNTISKKKQPGLLITSRWLRAASVLLLIGISAIIYFATKSKQPANPSNSFVTTSSKNTDPKITVEPGINDSSSVKTTTPASIVAVPSNPVTTTRASSKKNFVATSNTVKKQKHLPGNTINQHADQLSDNDMLFTLVNYTGKNWKPFFTKAITDKKITLNKYSYHNLTDKMVEMLQEMYLVKGNGKPTRKAKKTKRRFEKWRKKDEKYFDKTLQKNPADIIDLSEFILKNN